MKIIFASVLILLAPLTSKAQAALVLGEIDMGILASYHLIITDPENFVLGEEYELGGYLHDLDNGGILAITTSYIRNGAFGSNNFLPQNNYQIGKFSTAKMRFGKLWELNAIDVFASVGFGWMAGADYGDREGFIDLLFIDPGNPIGTFTIPLGVDLQWYGFDGSINSVGIKYQINGWNNYLGIGASYLL